MSAATKRKATTDAACASVKRCKQQGEDTDEYKCTSCNKVVDKTDVWRDFKGGSISADGVYIRLVICSCCEKIREQWQVLVKLPVPERGQIQPWKLDRVANDLVNRVGFVFALW